MQVTYLFHEMWTLRIGLFAIVCLLICYPRALEEQRRYLLAIGTAHIVFNDLRESFHAVKFQLTDYDLASYINITNDISTLKDLKDSARVDALVEDALALRRRFLSIYETGEA